MEETRVIRQERRISWTTFIVEVKLLNLLGGPLVAVTLAQYLLPIISMMMVGHLGELVLSSTALALSLASVTGYNLLVSTRLEFHLEMKLKVSFLKCAINLFMNH